MKIDYLNYQNSYSGLTKVKSTENMEFNFPKYANINQY